MHLCINSYNEDMMLNRNTGAGRVRRPAPRSAPNKVAPCHIAARLAAAHYEVPVAQLKSRRRGSVQSTRARHVAIYLAHVALGLKLTEVGSAFRRDRATASYACARVEDARDDPAFDATLSGLENSARILLDLAREKAA
jgi:chromosomal replication initiation ATPase DnaA